MPGKISVVGLGPGAQNQLTQAVREALASCDVLIGYKTYVDLVRDLVGGKAVVSTGMTEEVERGRKAYELAKEGKHVVMVSSGDAGVYGMAGLVYEVLEKAAWEPSQLEVEILPGVTAACSVAAVLGAPLNHDFCSISLSTLMTPWEAIEKRLEAAAAADFITVLYNPKSAKRDWQLPQAAAIFLKHRKPSTPVGLVSSAFREGQSVIRCTLSEMAAQEVGMLSTLVIGNSQTYYFGGIMLTPRGYQGKYDLAAP